MHNTITLNDETKNIFLGDNIVPNKYIQTVFLIGRKSEYVTTAVLCEGTAKNKPKFKSAHISNNVFEICLFENTEIKFSILNATTESGNKRNPIPPIPNSFPVINFAVGPSAPPIIPIEVSFVPIFVKLYITDITIMPTKISDENAYIIDTIFLAVFILFHLFLSI